MVGNQSASTFIKKYALQAAERGSTPLSYSRNILEGGVMVAQRYLRFSIRKRAALSKFASGAVS